MKAAVFSSAISEFARFGYIELIDIRVGIPEGTPDVFVPTIKRARPPIWIPGKNFPDDPWASLIL
jgi:hypothetical protein